MAKRITVLSRYSRRGASSRLRTMQYVPYLVAAGLEVEVASLFDDSYLDAMYAKRLRRLNVFGYFKNRLDQCRAARKSDVIWIEKEALPWLPWALERRLLPRDIPIVSDFDDALFHRYDLHRNSLVRGLLGRKIDCVMAESTLVTAGNDYLAERARLAGAPWVEIIPTVVSAGTYRTDRPEVPNSRPCIGWIGTPHTWNKYVVPMKDFFRDVAAEYGATFRLVGASLHIRTEEGFEFIPWSEATEVTAIQSMDIGIMPLTDDPWERGKCGYKLIQYMACGLPVIASPVGVNRSLVEHGVNGFLAQTESEWREALTTLLSDRSLRIRMGSAGRQKVVSGYSIEAQGPRIAGLMLKVSAGHAGA